MFDPRARIQQAINRCGISVRKLAAVGGGHPNHSQIAKYLRGDLWAPAWASDVALLAEQVADLISRGDIAPGDGPEKIAAAVEADRRQTLQSLEAMRFLGM